MKITANELVSEVMDVIYETPIELFSHEYEDIEKALKEFAKRLVEEGRL